MFWDRKQELQTLEREYERVGGSLVVIYGRRRVGKTTLIKEFIRDKPAMYFLADERLENLVRGIEGAHAGAKAAAGGVEDLKETVGEIKVQQAKMEGRVEKVHDEVRAQSKILKYIAPLVIALITGGGVVGNRALLGGVVDDINAATDDRDTTSAIEAPADEEEAPALAEEDDHDDDGA